MFMCDNVHDILHGLKTLTVNPAFVKAKDKIIKGSN